MIDIEIRQNENLVAVIQVPSEASDVNLRDFIDFASTKRIEGREIESMVLALSAFLKCDIGTILKMPIGEAGELPPVIEKGSLNTLNQLYAFVVQRLAIVDMRLMDFDSTIYKGVKYVLPPVVYREIKGAKFEDLSVLEAIDVMEIQRLAGMMNEEAEKEGKENDGSILYSRLLSTMAVLLRMEGESLPLDAEKRAEFIANRTQHFADMDLETALSVDFFLTNSLKKWKKCPPTVGFLSRLWMHIALETTKRRQTQRLKGQKRLTGVLAAAGLLLKSSSRARSK